MSEEYDFSNKENNVSPLYDKLSYFLEKLPNAGSIVGILLYSFILYSLMLLVRIFCSKPVKISENDDDDDLEDLDDDEIKEIIKNREARLKDPEFMKKIQAKRKQKAIEALKLLNKINTN